MFSGSIIYKLKYELLFIGLSMLLLMGIALLPKSPQTLAAPVATSSGILITQSQ